MFYLLHQYSKTRLAWCLLFFSGLILESIALYFQTHLELSPCSYCILQRSVILSIMLFALFAMIQPDILLFRLIAIFGWLWLSYLGLEYATMQSSQEQAILKISLGAITGLIQNCPTISYPYWLPLDYLFPLLFKPTGVCGISSWHFLTLEMSQWMIVIFLMMFSIAVAVLISQFWHRRSSKLY